MLYIYVDDLNSNIISRVLKFKSYVPTSFSNNYLQIANLFFTSSAIALILCEDD